VEVVINHSGGPIPSAFALCGSNLFLWMALDPERTHKLMDIVTESHIKCLEYIDDLKGIDHNHPIWLGCDTGEMMSAEYFKEFVVPYYQRIFERYPAPRIFHMCGKIGHILDILRDDMQINRLDGFGFPVPAEDLADSLAGRVVLRGGPHPVLIHDGPKEEILRICEHYIHTVGRHGGFILSEGFGVMAGTPPDHIEAMVEVSKRVGWIGKPYSP
jgi:uroporphyrinogen-III decarboxylase